MMCNFSTSWEEKHFILFKEMKKNNLVKLDKNSLSIPEKARPFTRSICMDFDVHLLENNPKTKLFSMPLRVILINF